MANLNNEIITNTEVIETIAVTQEGGEGDFAELRSINSVIENVSCYNVLAEGTQIKSDVPFAENDILHYNGDIFEDNFAVVAYTGNGTSQNIITGIESYDINYDAGRTYTAGSGNNTEYAFDRATMKLWQYINGTPASGAPLAEGADWTEVADNVEIDFLSSTIWVKSRSAVGNHFVTDTIRGLSVQLVTDGTNIEDNYGTMITDTSDKTLTLGSSGGVNTNSTTYIVWQKRYNKVKAVTTNQGKRAIVAYDTEAGRSMTLYEGNNTAGHEVPHGLGATPDFTVVKGLESVTAWFASRVTGQSLRLDTTDAEEANTTRISSLDATNVVLGANINTNPSGEKLIMYSETSVADQIKIGTYTGTGAAGNYVDCGFEPEYVMIKSTSHALNWYIFDTSKATGGVSSTQFLIANSSNAEATSVNTGIYIDKKGFRPIGSNVNSNTYSFLYIAYAKGSKTKKTIGTDTAQVTGVSSNVIKNFASKTYTGNGTSLAVTTGINSEDFTSNTNSSDYYLDRTTFEVKTKVGDVVTDSGSIQLNTSKVHIKNLSSVANHKVFDGLRGPGEQLYTNLTNAETLNVNTVTSFDSNGFTVGSDGSVNENTSSHVVYQTLYTHIRWGITNHNRRYVEAYNPFTGEGMILYEGSGSAGHQLPHSLGIEHDFTVVKSLGAVRGWNVVLDNPDEYLQLDTTAAKATLVGYRDNGALSITFDASVGHNNAGEEYILYGKAKSRNWTIVEYTGTGAAGNYIETKDVNGVPRRPRSVVIKRVDSTSNWGVFDSERSNDGYAISLNSSSAEGTNDYINIISTGFEYTSVVPTDFNTSGGKYIALVEFDTNGTLDDSYYTEYVGTHNSSIAPEKYINTADSSFEWSLDNGVQYHPAVPTTVSEVNGVVTTTYADVQDLDAGNRDIICRVTNKVDGRALTKIEANVYKKG